MTERVGAPPSEASEGDGTLKRGVQTPGGLPDWLLEMTTDDLFRPRELTWGRTYHDGMTERVGASPSEASEGDGTLKRGVQTPGGLPDWLLEMTAEDLARPEEKAARLRRARRRAAVLRWLTGRSASIEGHEPS